MLIHSSPRVSCLSSAPSPEGKTRGWGRKVAEYLEKEGEQWGVSPNWPLEGRGEGEAQTGQTAAESPSAVLAFLTQL